MSIKKLGLVAGRHNIPVSDYIFDQILDPTDFNGMAKKAIYSLEKHFPNKVVRSYCPENAIEYTDLQVEFRGTLHLYVTGLTSATLTVVNACRVLGIDLVVYHYNPLNNKYVGQKVNN